ncbi:MAG TPA: hypothetical protein VG942_09600 [Hyphomonadaceae bacterium]|nr:hypothetical protein [Hyphomonadaceae bacterium]
MIRRAGLVVLAVAALGLGACGESPQQKAEREQKEAAAKLASVLGGAVNPLGGTPDQQKAAAAMLGTLAANDPNMTAEDKAKAQKIFGAMASGNVNPAASAYMAGLNKVSAVIATVKDDASANAAQAQLAPIFAEMKGPADQLNAMNKDDRDVAMGSAAMQIMTA